MNTLVILDAEGRLIGRRFHDILAETLLVPESAPNPDFDPVLALKRIWPAAFLIDKYNSRWSDVLAEYNRLCNPHVWRKRTFHLVALDQYSFDGVVAWYMEAAAA